MSPEGKWVVDGEYYDYKEKQWLTYEPENQTSLLGTGQNKVELEVVIDYCTECSNELDERDNIDGVCRTCFNYYAENGG